MRDTGSKHSDGKEYLSCLPRNEMSFKATSLQTLLRYRDSYSSLNRETDEFYKPFWYSSRAHSLTSPLLIKPGSTNELGLSTLMLTSFGCILNTEK